MKKEVAELKQELSRGEQAEVEVKNLRESLEEARKRLAEVQCSKRYVIISCINDEKNPVGIHAIL